MHTFSQDEKDILLNLAQWTLQHYMTHHEVPELDGSKFPPALQETHNVFVTLKKRGQLRGCIGTMDAQAPLYETIMLYTLHAALKDPRFPPVTASELPHIDIKLSILLPAHPVHSYRDIQLGTHGIILEKQGHHALFLPNVPTEQGWDLDSTLTHLALKAGLQAHDWKENCQFSVFEGIDF